VVTTAIDLLWTAPVENWAKFATSALMRNLLRFRHLDRDRLLAVIEATLGRHRGGTEYLRRWAVGHFVQWPPAVKARADEMAGSRGIAVRRTRDDRRGRRRARGEKAI
jgi:hypothetical protein